MENYKKGMFTGWKEVFNFTAVQSIKGKGFKLTTILIALVVATIFALIPIIDNYNQEDSNVEDIVETYGGIVDDKGNYNFKTIKKIYLINDTDYSNDNMKLLFNVSEKKLNNIDEIVLIDEITDEIAKEADAIVINADNKSYGVHLNILSTYNTTVDEEEANVLGIVLMSDTSFAAYGCGKFDAQQMQMLGMPSYVETASDSEESFGVMIAKIIVPMLVSLFMYMIILLHGQAISKVIVADKSSKLMEMLLTSVRPYAIITGKVLGVATVALGQVFIWIISGVAGFFIGDIIAGMINPDYVNILLEIINFIKADSDGFGFSVFAIILAILGMVLGFLLYAVLAGLAGALVSKVEDLSAASNMFQLPVVISFMVAYLTSIISATEGSGGLMLDIVRICPLTSPFVVPADILLGSMSMVQSVVSIVLLFISCFVLIVVTGKIYKGKIFYKK